MLEKDLCRRCRGGRRGSTRNARDRAPGGSPQWSACRAPRRSRSARRAELLLRHPPPSNSLRCGSRRRRLPRRRRRSLSPRRPPGSVSRWRSCRRARCRERVCGDNWWRARSLLHPKVLSSEAVFSSEIVFLKSRRGCFKLYKSKNITES